MTDDFVHHSTDQVLDCDQSVRVEGKLDCRDGLILGRQSVNDIRIPLQRQTLELGVLLRLKKHLRDQLGLKQGVKLCQ